MLNVLAISISILIHVGVVWAIILLLSLKPNLATSQRGLLKNLGFFAMVFWLHVGASCLNIASSVFFPVSIWLFWPTFAKKNTMLDPHCFFLVTSEVVKICTKKNTDQTIGWWGCYIKLLWSLSKFSFTQLAVTIPNLTMAIPSFINSHQRSSWSGIHP
jgi:hypothetical protein